MKLCQSELVLHKVERFCSLALSSRWPGFSLFYFVLVCLVLWSLVAFCSFLFKAEKIPFYTGSGDDSCIKAILYLCLNNTHHWAILFLPVHLFVTHISKISHQHHSQPTHQNCYNSVKL